MISNRVVKILDEKGSRSSSIVSEDALLYGGFNVRCKSGFKQPSFVANFTNNS